jgi:hypothetical protein
MQLASAPDLLRVCDKGPKSRRANCHIRTLRLKYGTKTMRWSRCIAVVRHGWSLSELPVLF